MKNYLKKFILLLLAGSMLTFSGCFTPEGSADGDETENNSENENIPADDTEKNEDEPISDRVEPVTDSKFTLYYDSEKSLNPYTSDSVDNLLLAGLIYEGLFTVKNDFSTENNLCAFYETEDGVTFTFTLLPGVSFHNGKSVTAKDAVYSITTAKASGLYSSRLSIIESVQAVDELSFTITLTSENRSLPALLDVPIIPQNSAGDSVPAGTGPYTVNITSESVFLSPSSQYRGSKATTLIWLCDIGGSNAAFEFSSKNIDLLSGTLASSSADNIHVNCETRYYDTTTLTYIGFNTTDEVFSSAAMRRAIFYVLDRDTLFQDISSARLQSPLILSPALYCYDSAWKEDTSFSITAYSEIFNQIGLYDSNSDGYLDYPTSGGYISFTVKFIVDDSSADREVLASSIVSMLNRAGIKTELSVLSWEDYTAALQSGSFDMYLAEGKLSSNFDLSPLFCEGGSLNFGRISDENYSSLISAFLNAKTGEAKASAAQGLCSYACEKSHVIPLSYRKDFIRTHRGAVSGLSPSQSNIFRGISDCTITP